MPSNHLSNARMDTQFFDKPPSTKCCCGRISLQKGASIVGGLSLLSVLLNAILIVTGVGRLGLNVYIEIFIVILDLITVICLLRGLHKKKSSLLKPFMWFNFLWNILLLLLFIWCSWRMAKGTDLARPILVQLGKSHSQSRQRPFGTLGMPPSDENNIHKWMAFLLLLALASLIFIGCSFINIVYRTFRVFAYEEEKESSRLTPPI